MKKFYVIFFTVLSLSGFCQNKSNAKIIKQKLAEANYYYQYDNFYFALPVFKEILTIDSTNLESIFKSAVCLFNLNENKLDGKEFFEKSKFEYSDSYFYLGRILHSEHLFDQAIDTYLFYNKIKGKLTFDEKIVEYYIEKSKVAKQFESSKNNISVENLGDKINSKFPDYGTVISADEQQMHFTSRRENGTGNLKNTFNEFYEDIYLSQKKDNEWLHAVNIETPINTSKHDACVAISDDGKELYIYRTNIDSTGGDIYISKLVDDKWSNPEIIDADINTRLSWTPSGSISADGNTFYFSSNRAGGMGGKDIYKVSKLPNGKWSLAVNLGASINTIYDEDAPYICHDRNTLYFSSKGHKNMGEFDIFVSHLDSNIWSNAENLGFPVNTVDNDIYYVPSSDQVSAYLSSDRKGGLGSFDIYKTFDINHITNYVAIKGIVNNELQTKVLNAKISVIDYYSRELHGIYNTNKNTGKFLLILFKNRKYKMIVEAEGYQSYIEDFELTRDFSEKEIFKNIKLIGNE